jgi:hypothetical protein
LRPLRRYAAGVSNRQFLWFHHCAWPVVYVLITAGCGYGLVTANRRATWKQSDGRAAGASDATRQPDERNPAMTRLRLLAASVAIAVAGTFAGAGLVTSTASEAAAASKIPANRRRHLDILHDS